MERPPSFRSSRVPVFRLQPPVATIEQGSARILSGQRGTVKPGQFPHRTEPFRPYAIGSQRDTMFVASHRNRA
jgi:hypothetical protein